MKREDITALGIEDKDVLDKILAINGADIEKHKNQVQTLTAERDGLKTQLGEANTKLEGYDPEWKTKATQAQQEAEAQLAGMKLDFALDRALAAAKARDTVSVRAHLKTENLKLDGDQIIGLDEQLKTLQTDKAFLFEEAAPQASAARVGSAIEHGSSPENLDAFTAAAMRGARLKQGE